MRLRTRANPSPSHLASSASMVKGEESFSVSPGEPMFPRAPRVRVGVGVGVGLRVRVRVRG